MISEKKIKVKFVKDTDDKGHIPDGQFTLIYDKIPGGGSGGTVDTELDKNSTNPVENRAIATAIEELQGQITTEITEVENELEGI